MADNLKLELYVFTDCKVGKARTFKIDLLLLRGGGGTPYIRMIGMTIVFFRGWNRRFGIFRGCSSKIL